MNLLKLHLLWTWINSKINTKFSVLLFWTVTSSEWLLQYQSKLKIISGYYVAFYHVNTALIKLGEERQQKVLRGAKLMQR